jgi:hypothetical protein
MNAVRRVAIATALVAGSAALAGPVMAATASSAKPGGTVTELAAGQVGSRAQVPWSRVGPGWALAEYSATTGGEGAPVRSGADTLYLVDPAGGRYTMATWPRNSAPTKWTLTAWSGDAQRALFAPAPTVAREQVHQLDLRTGQFSSFWMPGNIGLIEYTRPDGLNILVARAVSQSDSQVLERYNLRGQLQKSLATVAYLGQAVYQPAGAELAAGNDGGLDIISNAGGIIRSIPVPGVTNGCTAERWWTASTVLASCWAETGPRLWLVPANGARPRALTPARRGGFDFGDFNAWQLSSGLYLDGYGACGTLVIGKQPAHGPETEVNVPGSSSSLIITATSSTLMVERINGCENGNSLVWFNPASRAMTVAVPDVHHQWGVINAIPYYVAGKF